MGRINAARVALAGVVAGVVMLVLGGVIGLLTGHLYAGPMWKPMAGMSWYVWMLLHNVFFGLVFAVLYAVFGNALEGSKSLKGFVYGFVIWLFSLPGLSMTFLTMMVGIKLLFIWGVQGLIGFVLAGIIIAHLYRE